MYFARFYFVDYTPLLEYNLASERRKTSAQTVLFNKQSLGPSLTQDSSVLRISILSGIAACDKRGLDQINADRGAGGYAEPECDL